MSNNSYENQNTYNDALYTYEAPVQYTGKMATARFVLGLVGFSQVLSL